MTGDVRVVGILGGGQLGWMLGAAARRLDLDCVFLDPSETCTADLVGPRIRAGYDDPKALEALASRVDVVTYEFENVPADSARRLSDLLPVRPGPRSLEVAQDRVVEKEFVRGLGIPVPDFIAVSEDADLGGVGLPAILKTRRGGYDGKGQARVTDPESAARAVAEMGTRDLILEAMVPFDHEASVLVVRGLNGETRTWTPSCNLHAEGILRRSKASDPVIPPEVESRMRRHATEIADALEHVGVLAVEFFVVGDRVLVNEIAPRVHNSGHLTIEHATTSQFENHIRAVAGLPLGDTGPRFPSATMLNAIGASPRTEDLDRLEVRRVDPDGRLLGPPAGDGDAVWHDYRKSARPGRKVGHLTIVGERSDPSRIEALSSIVPGAATTE